MVEQHPNLTPQEKIADKALWKALILEFCHNYFIGISNLICSQEDCPLVLHWDDLEEKNSKKGKSAIIQVSKKAHKFLVVDLEENDENDWGQIEKMVIRYKSGRTQRTKPHDYQEPKNQEKREIFLNPEELVCFFNNPTHTPNLIGAEAVYLEWLWNTRARIQWDQEKSKKKVFIRCENEPGEEAQGKKIGAVEKDYLFYISNPEITNEIKQMEIYSPTQGTEERNQLWRDYKEDFSELRRVFGMRHLTSKKEERQNNPEIELNEAQFIALERRKQKIREQSIKEFERKGFCSGEHVLVYGVEPVEPEEEGKISPTENKSA